MVVDHIEIFLLNLSGQTEENQKNIIIIIIIIIIILTAIGLAPGGSSPVHIYREHYIEYINNTQNK